MQRRTVLKLLAASALAGCDTGERSAARRKIVVAGAGIIGASIAYQLAKAGAEVTVIDRQGPATHASRASFAWINATWAKQPQYYHAFSQRGVAAWHELQRELELPVRWGGSMEWYESAERAQQLTEQIAEQAAWGEPARMLDADEFAALEPGIHIDAAARIAFSPNDGAVDPIRATEILLAAALHLGAKLQFPCGLTDVTLQNGRLSSVETSNGSMPADRLVLATGAAEQLPLKIAGIDIPQRSRPGVTVITEPLPPRLQHIISAPGVHMHQRNDGCIVLGEQDGPPQNEAHAMRLAARPNDFPDPVIAQQHAVRILAVAEKFSPGISAARVDHVFIGWRPLPIDGHPVIGASPERPDIYLAIMHSGVTLAALVGELAAEEILSDMRVSQLSNYRPERTFEEIIRY